MSSTIPTRHESEGAHCKDCGTQLGRGNRSGYCNRHVSAANARKPEWREKQREGIKAKYQRDPAYLERKRADMRRANGARDLDALRERMIANRYWEKSNAERPKGHPSRLQAGRTVRATRLAWCPPHLRDEYVRLNCVAHIPAAEARRIILDQHEKEMERFRRRIGK